MGDVCIARTFNHTQIIPVSLYKPIALPIHQEGTNRQSEEERKYEVERRNK
jgi:hypothetical protein